MVKQESSSMQSSAYACTRENIDECSCSYQQKKVTVDKIGCIRVPVSMVKTIQDSTMAAKVMSELRINDKLNIFFSHTRMEPTILCQTLETTALTSFF